MTLTVDQPIEIQTPTQVPPDTIETIVTMDDIRSGTQGSASQCAIALSFRRVHSHALVYSGYAYAKGGRYFCREAAAWITQFDTDKSKCYPERFVWLRDS